jgi:hypothetical protein
VPYKYRVLHKLIDTNDDGVVTDTEMAAAVAVLEKAKNKKKKETAHNNYLSFNSNLNNN